MDLKFKEALDLLTNSKSAKRESGAKRLRKLGSSEAGQALLETLQKEVKDTRTWSTQYHIILAIGASQYEKAIPFLWELASNRFDATILYYAIGDTLFRLMLLKHSIEESLQKIYQTGNFGIMYGSFRALALLKLIPDDITIKKILEIAINPEAEKIIKSYPGDKTGLKFWIAVAAANWKRELVIDFLIYCQNFEDNALKLAVENSLKGKYIKWNPY